MLISAAAFILLFAPFVLYVVVKKRSGWSRGVGTAMVASAVVFLPVLWLVPDLKMQIMVAVALVLVLGGLSLKMRHPLYFLLEPAIRAWVSALYLGVFRLFDDSVMEKLFSSLVDTPEVQDSLPDELRMQLTEEQGRQFFINQIHNIEADFIITMVLYGILMIFVARRYGDVTWLVFKGLFTPILLLGGIVGFFLRA